MRSTPGLVAALITLAALAPLALVGCAPADDGFRARVAQGCGSEAECATLHQWATARAAGCASEGPRTSDVPCEDAEADARVTAGYLESRRAEARRARAAWEQQESQRRASEAWAAEQAQEAARRESAAAEAREAEKTFRAAEREREREREREAERARLAALQEQEAERALAAEAQARPAAATHAAQPAKESPPASDHVRCCDGSYSPTCATVHRGCCSHHGGVCD